jgi:hypothetical protein
MRRPLRALGFAETLEMPVRLAVFPVPAPPGVLPDETRLQARNCPRSSDPER